MFSIHLWVHVMTTKITSLNAFKHIDHEGTPTPSLLIRSRTPYRISHASLLLFWYFVYGLTSDTSVNWNTSNQTWAPGAYKPRGLF